nr:MAG TPA: hypothetical protein [Caudoviricetes sp.]
MARIFTCWHSRCLRYRLHPLPDGGGDKRC